MNKIIHGLIVVSLILILPGCGNLLTDSPKSSTKEITSFSLSRPDTTAVIVDSTRTIIVNVPFGTAVTELTPTITHTGAGIDPLSGAARNFSNPVTYTVTA
ncbi:MAG: hypothetical protein JW913_11355, partial [Chitinispirillaceae bacterium]|nr:hypothetical protein [Chitinispirillaceae bacterium]